MTKKNPTVSTLRSAVEAVRLEALQELRILDTAPEQAFDDLAWLASRPCGPPLRW